MFNPDADGIDTEIAAMKTRELAPTHAHHLMVDAVEATLVPARDFPR
jgi:hypothetical protein